jgi:hypothetical protein
LDIDEAAKKFAIHYHGLINTYLCEKYFLNGFAFVAVRALLCSLDKKSAREAGFLHVDQMLIDTKKKILPHLKRNEHEKLVIYCGYDSVADGKKFDKEELSLYLLHYDDKDEKYDKR